MVPCCIRVGLGTIQGVRCGFVKPQIKYLEIE
jgi:hypothetical protein